MSVTAFVIVALWSGWLTVPAEALQCNTTWNTYNGWQVNTPYEQTTARNARECAAFCNRRQCSAGGCKSYTFSTASMVCSLSNAMSGDMTDLSDATLKTGAVPEPVSSVTYQGTEFYTAFLYNLVLGTLDLNFVSTLLANVRVEIPYLSINETFPVQGTVRKAYSTTLVTSTDNSELSTGIYINADIPITVYNSNNYSTSEDMSLVLPTAGIGTNYILQTIGDTDDEFVIVSTKDNNQVDVKVGNVTTTYNLPRFGTLFRKASGLTGTEITASANVAVMAGNACANIPVGRAACDQIWEQVAPEESSGVNFIVANMYPRGEHTVSVMATAVDTVIDIYDASQTPLTSDMVGRGQGVMYEYLANQTLSIVASKPVQVVQYSHGGVGMLPYGDPAMMAIPPLDKLGVSYDLWTPGGSNELSVLSVTTDDESLIRLNGVLPTYEYASTVSATFGIYRVAYVYLAPSMVYTITHVNNEPFAAYMYGGERDAEFSMSLGWNKI